LPGKRYTISPAVVFTTMVGSVLWLLIFAEIVNYSARVFNRGGVVWQHFALRVIDFPFAIRDDEEVAGHVIRADR
jgi:hypothetical protein